MADGRPRNVEQTILQSRSIGDLCLTWFSPRGYARAHIYNGGLSASNAGASGAEVYEDTAR